MASERATNLAGAGPGHPLMRTRLPLWVRWLVSLVVFSALGAGLVVLSRDRDALYSSDPAAQAEADRLARIVMAEDQQPHTAAWRRGTRPGRQLEREITRDVRERVRRGQLTGRLNRVRCGSARRRTRGRVGFSCTAVVDGVTYPFAGAADRRARRLTWCKRNPGPNRASEVPLDRRCTS